MLSESASRPVLVETSRIAAQLLGGRSSTSSCRRPRRPGPSPIRSTGASQALAGNRGAIAALAAADLVIDCTVEGLLHAPELGEILGGGARVLMISNEHPENFERYASRIRRSPQRVELGVALLEEAAEMRVTSAAGTDLTARLEGAFRAGSSGVATRARHDRALAGRPVPRVPRGALRPGRRRAGARRHQPHVQALRARRR